MQDKRDKPLTEAELFKILEYFLGEIQRLFNNGMVAEGADWEIDSTKEKIAAKQEDARRLREKLARVKSYADRRKQREKERH